MVEGTVVGREGSQAAVPLVGVAVVVKGSLRNHAVTDLQGRYSIRVPSSTDTLQFTYLGYKPLERVVGSRTRLDVEMLSESQQVDAVVVTALGLTRKEKSLGYAVSTVGSEDLNNTVTNNWLNGMAGKVAGLNFDTSSAGPGGSIRVTLRGEGSLAYDKNEALFVVDGVPINSGMTSNTENGSYGSTVSTIDYGNGASDLNPDDIESVSVLKGPAATALYGSRAANGAIIITTKSGLKSGGLRVTFNSNVTLEQAGFWPDFQEEYGSGVYESAQIDGVTTPPEYSYWNVAADKSDTGQKITRYHARSSFGERYDPSKMRYIYSSRNWDTDEYTRKPWVAQDWYKGFFRTGVTYSNSISIEGGNGKGNSARVSFKDMRNDWIVPNTGYESQNLSFSFSTRISKAVTVSGKANYYRKNSDNLPSAGYSTASPLYALIWNPSSVSVDDMYAEWSEGRIGQSDQPQQRQSLFHGLRAAQHAGSRPRVRQRLGERQYLARKADAHAARRHGSQQRFSHAAQTAVFDRAHQGVVPRADGAQFRDEHGFHVQLQGLVRRFPSFGGVGRQPDVSEIPECDADGRESSRTRRLSAGQCRRTVAVVQHAA